MRYGFYLPTRGPTATRDGILALAREGERLGLHSTPKASSIPLGKMDRFCPVPAVRGTRRS
jgi:hypothetical protein